MANEEAFADHWRTSPVFPDEDDWDGWRSVLCREDTGTLDCVPQCLRSKDLMIHVGQDGRLIDPDMLPDTPYGVAKFLHMGIVNPPWARTPISEPPKGWRGRAERPASSFDFEIGGPSPGGPQVYMISSAAGPIKIGMSTNPDKRLKTLQTAHPWKLTLLCAVGGGSELEAHYHSKFAAHRLEGEWFSPHPAILAEIDRLNAQRPATPYQESRR